MSHAIARRPQLALTQVATPPTVTLPQPLPQPSPQWQILTRAQPRKHGGVYVHTAPSGRISFSIAAYRLLGSPRDIEILLDRPNGCLGFRPATSDRRSWRVSLATPSTASVCSAKLLRLLNLRAASHIFPATLQQGTLVISTTISPLPELHI